MPFPPGALVGPYEILSPLAAGGMGEVYRARDSRLGREVAIKVLADNVAGDGDRLRRFQLEARAAGSLNHPNILTVHDAGEHEGRPYLVTELLEGQTLRKHLERGPMPVSTTVDYALQIARGLSAAHAKGITHRDLKPDNLFITSEGTVKILDFGLAKISASPLAPTAISSSPTAGPQTAAGAIMGSAGYMSPEQVRGDEADARSDIFSFGAVLHEMLSGKRCFTGSSWYDAMNAVVQRDPPALPGNIPPALDRLVRCCLEKRPEDRFQSAHDLVLALSSAAAPAARPRMVRRKPIVVAAAVLCLLSAGLLWWRHEASKPELKLHQLTFRHGTVSSARFTADGQTVAYSARWDTGRFQVYTSRLDNSESSKLEITGEGASLLLAVSRAGEMALLLPRQGISLYELSGTLATLPLAGGTPREVAEEVASADWSPDGAAMALVRVENGVRILEYRGAEVYRTPDLIDCVRISPRGDAIAFLDHPLQADFAGAVAVADLRGRVRTLSRRFNSVRGLAWRGDEKEIWFTAAPEGATPALYAVSLSGAERMLARLPGYAVLEDVSRQGDALVSAHRLSDSMFLVPPGSVPQVDRYWHDASLVRDLSADGNSILFSESGEPTGGDFEAWLRTSGGAVRLGPGLPMSLSPDGKWAIANPAGAPAQLVLLPVGPGTARPLTSDSIHHVSAQWLPGGGRFLFVGREKGQKLRYWVQGMDGSAAKPITTEDIRFDRSEPIVVSPDGQELAYRYAGGLALRSIGGGEPRDVRGAEPEDIPLRWCRDGGLMVHQAADAGALYRLDLASGRRELWRQLVPANTVGLVNIAPVRVSADCRSCAYSTLAALTDLYVVRGLR